MKTTMLNNHQRGAALLEFALVLPLLIMLSVIATEFGRALYQYNTIAKSVRDAARYLSVQDSTILTTDYAKVNIAKNLVVYGNPTGSGVPLAFGLAKDQVLDPTWMMSGASPQINTVTITVKGCASSPAPCYRFVPLFNNVFGLDFGSMNYANISSTMRAPS
ncbi:pilus assembly protein [Variovorax paradoxus]|nr:TadE family protein [Variovorax paradoxus]MBT2303028.1 pilus assembly protein [Variovorax paradoxus]